MCERIHECQFPKILKIYGVELTSCPINSQKCLRLISEENIPSHLNPKEFSVTTSKPVGQREMEVIGDIVKEQGRLGGHMLC